LYSNFAVGYIAALIEWATEGQTFPDFTRQHIFEPLGMDHTAWFRRDLPSGTVEAVPVETANRRGTRFQDIGHYCFIDYASGSLRSTASDLSKFLQSMLNYGVPDLWLSPPSNGLANNSTINTNSSSSSVLGQESLNCLEKDQNGQPVKASNCEFGANWILLSNAQKKGAEEWLEPFSHYDWTDGAHHDGAEAGSQTQILVLPRAGVYAAVLTNTDGNDEYAAQMMAVDLLYEISGGRPRYATKPLAWGFPVLALLVVSLWE
jgi:CubicO group peptidase (beta-lactamase class C family)